MLGSASGHVHILSPRQLPSVWNANSIARWTQLVLKPLLSLDIVHLQLLRLVWVLQGGLTLQLNP